MIDSRRRLSSSCADVKLRPFPYPYRCMLAICSDLDDTLDKHVYIRIMRFLNTTDMTAMGKGVGLEVGNSIHFRANPGIFSYRNTDDDGREIVQRLIHSGHIDCLHTFGELVRTRDEARQVLDELKERDCHLEVWVDHGGTTTSFGSDIMCGHGDEVDHEAYHADLTIDYGVKYVCRGRVTSVIGQGVPARLNGILKWNHPIASSRTLLKEMAKEVLARAGNAKYAMHRSNELLRPIVLRNGRAVYEFMRCNPHWRGVSYADEGRHIGKVLTEDMLNHLVSRGGFCVLYTHLGRVDDPEIPFNAQAVTAFHRLAEEHHGGRILVTTTRRLLGYYRAVRDVMFSVYRRRRGTYIDLDTRSNERSIGELPAADLAGLTFYVSDPKTTHMMINGRESVNCKHNAPDCTGWPSVSLSWPALEFPD